ncbi:hypothetical protein C4580_03195 [Candidatus Woesearchaeota archaeon]|nr:MAG: hypothetical protein C4580_03195 [Candidatus Woesearchaeota archaeon]
MSEHFRWRKLTYRESVPLDRMLRKFGNVFVLQRKGWFFFRDTDVVLSYQHEAREGLCSLGKEQCVRPFWAKYSFGPKGPEFVAGSKVLYSENSFHPDRPVFDYRENAHLLEELAGASPADFVNAPLETGLPECRLPEYRSGFEDVVQRVYARMLDPEAVAREMGCETWKVQEGSIFLQPKVAVPDEKKKGGKIIRFADYQDRSRAV